MEHSDLIAELPLIEKLTAVERIQLAKQRRALQLMRWQEREQKATSSSSLATGASGAGGDVAQALRGRRRKKLRVHFSSGTVLLESTARQDVQEVRQMLSNGADPNCHNEDGLTALHQCAIDNETTIMQLLIDHGADVNARDTELWTPLHAAACCGHIAAMEMLIKNGAELLAVNSDGNMPYDICDEEAALDFVETEMANRGITQEDIDEERLCNERRMLDDMKAMHGRGDPLDVRDKGGATPLHAACASGYYSVVEFLLESGCWVHVRDNDGWQPIHAAACWAQPDIIELLVQFGADINARTNSGETALDVCEDETTRSVLLALLVEVHRRRLLTFARDSRRMSKRKKPCSKFESPAPVVSSNQDSRFSSTRSAVRRMSIRDRCGVTLARLEARREAAVMRSWSFGESDRAQPASLSSGQVSDEAVDKQQSSDAKEEPSSDGKAAEQPFHSLPTRLNVEKKSSSSGEKQQQQQQKKFWEKLYTSSVESSPEKGSVDVTSPSTSSNGKKTCGQDKGAANESRGSGQSTVSQLSTGAAAVGRRRPAVDERRKGTAAGRLKATAPKPPAANLSALKQRAPSKPAKMSRLRCCAIS